MVLLTEPPREVWPRRVESVRREIGEGEFEKLVLTRRCFLRGEHAFDPFAIHARLRSTFPSCFNVTLGRAGDSFVCATPELLVRQRGRRIGSGSLAGTIARGRTRSEDRRLARALMESKKDHAERRRA